MNLENENTELAVTDLGLGQIYSNHSIIRRRPVKELVGTSANANSRLNFLYTPNNHPLSELVWCPQTGLRNYPIRGGLGLVRETNIIVSQQTEFNMSLEDDKRTLEEKSFSEGTGGAILSIPQLKKSNHVVDDDCHMDGDYEQDIAQPADVDCATENECEALGSPLKSLMSPMVSKYNESTASIEQKGESEIKARDSPNNLNSPLETKFGSTAESKRSHQIEDLHDDVEKDVSENSRRHREDKEKANSSAGKKSKDDDNSHESAESCNSAGVLCTTKKRLNTTDPDLILKGKRFKRQLQEHHGSGSYVKQNSSFMSWISNMTRPGWKVKEDQETPSLALTVAHPSPDLNTVTVSGNRQLECKYIGFQSVFRSLYCSNTRIQEEIISENTRFEEKKSEPNLEIKETESLENRISENLISSETKDITNPSIKNLGSANDHSRSLWITRFTPKFNSTLDHRNVSTGQALDCSMPVTSAPSNDENDNLQKTLMETDSSVNVSRSIDGHNDENPVCETYAPRIKNSEAMACLFAKRLDAIKHIMPSEVPENVLCFFCGQRGHHIRDCADVTDSELEDLLKNCDGAKESSSYCIKCFQLNHWAATCPAASFKRKHQLGFRLKSDKNSKIGCVVYDGSHSGITNLKLSKSLNEMRHATDGLKYKTYEASSSGVNKDRGPVMPIGNFVPKQILDVPKGLFQAVQTLRVSRTDILKLMKLKASISKLDGFFLRLRLGKWKEGLGGTGYHVASITGTQSSPGNSISVIVGGMKCLVESQYISNQNFLEDELKTWWCAAAKSDGKIPSEEYLSQKLKEKRMLGI